MCSCSISICWICISWRIDKTPSPLEPNDKATLGSSAKSLEKVGGSKEFGQQCQAIDGLENFRDLKTKCCVVH